MDFSHYSDEPVGIAVDLANTIDMVSGVDKLTSPTDVGAFIREHGRGWCAPDWEPTERDLHEVRALRSRLRAAFDAPDQKAAAAVLNGAD